MEEREGASVWQKLRVYAQEIDLHADRLRSAKLKCRDFMPLDTARYETLSVEKIEHLDWMLYRFSKMQDALAQKLFPYALTMLENDATWLNRPIIDLLNRMEKIGFLPDARGWRRLRGVRNMIAHDYETLPDRAVDTLNGIYEATDELLSAWGHMRGYLTERELL